MKLAPFLAGLLVGAGVPAPAVEWQGESIKLTAEEAAKCAAQGGCVVITVDVLRTVVDAAQDCRRRGSI